MNHYISKYIKNLRKNHDIVFTTLSLCVYIFVERINQITYLFRQPVDDCANKVAKEVKSISQGPNLKVTLSAINTPHAMAQYFVRWFLSDAN